MDEPPKMCYTKQDRRISLMDRIWRETMNDQTKVRGRFRIYLQWPVMLSALWILLTVAVSAVNLLAGIMVSAATLIYMAISL